MAFAEVQWKHCQAHLELASYLEQIHATHIKERVGKVKSQQALDLNIFLFLDTALEV